jgi:hypothetical protein
MRSVVAAVDALSRGVMVARACCQWRVVCV